MSDDILKQVNANLELLVALTAANLAKGMTQADAIVLLGAAGLDRNLIAEVLGTTPGTVSVRLSNVKAERAVSKKKVAPKAASMVSDEQA